MLFRSRAWRAARDLNAPEVTELRAKLWEQVREESLKAMGSRP